MQTVAESWLDVLDEDGETPMTRAFKSGNFGLTQIVCEYEKKNGLVEGEDPIHRAAFLGQDELIEKYIQEGVDPDVRDSHGETALHKAVRQGHYTTVLTLLYNGAIPNVRDGLGLAPLHWLALKGNNQLVELLMQFGADVNVRDSFGAMTPFTYARLLGYKKLARMLARFGGTW